MTICPLLYQILWIFLFYLCLFFIQEKDDKISQMEESIKEEKDKLSRERKEVNELVRATKNETKILNEKINKLVIIFELLK